MAGSRLLAVTMMQDLYQVLSDSLPLDVRPSTSFPAKGWTAGAFSLVENQQLIDEICRPLGITTH
jgi:hypothetical protein